MQKNNGGFRDSFGESIFNLKYRHEGCETWEKLAETLVEDVCGGLLPDDEKQELVEAISGFKFIPGGRYLYYAGRPNKAYFNCFLAIPQEDTREEWAKVVHWATQSLTQGGGIGVDYSVFRPKDMPLSRTGGKASGPISLMNMVNEIGRYVMQGGSRRSAIYASLNWQHADAEEFLKCKDWPEVVKAQKLIDFNFPGQLDMTNVSLNYDNNFLAYVARGALPKTFQTNVRQAMETGEPGFSFNFGSRVNETARNACTEVTSSSPFDSCNLGSLNLGQIETLAEVERLAYLGSRFLYCGTVRGTIDHPETRDYQLQNRRLGLGLMGVHEWSLKNNLKYGMNPKLREWLTAWRDNSETGANELADRLGCPRPKGYRAIAPTGSIGILAGTTTGIEPLFAVAYKRRYLKGRDQWHYQYVVDSTAKHLIELYGLNPDNIETASDLATDYERRIAFQADVQDYVDMAISSTINLPAWGTEHNNEDKVKQMTKTLAKYAPRLRGFTCYPDGSRGGQPLTAVPYAEAIAQEGTEFKEHDICEIGGKGGSCGV